jgi:hypothetical protein
VRGGLRLRLTSDGLLLALSGIAVRIAEVQRAPVLGQAT